MRVVALLATYNEERFIAPCIEHLRSQGVLVHLIDNGSTDRTVELAEPYLGDGLLAIETLPRGEVFEWNAVLARKEELAAELEADWFVHHDADEFRASPRPGWTVADELAGADAAGYDAVNFMEFTFVPCAEEPDHDHPRFLETMRWYYPFAPSFPSRVNAWKRRDEPVDLRSSGGHLARYDGQRLSPRTLWMRHYLYLGREHAARKYVARAYSPAEVAAGAHGWRARVRPEDVVFPPKAELREYVGDPWLDPAGPRRTHPVADRVAA